MRMYDLIEKKKLGKALTQQEIDWMVQGYTQGEIPDYQMSAFLMAVCFQGMNIEETTAMTLSMAHSGQMSDPVSYTHLFLLQRNKKPFPKWEG